MASCVLGVFGCTSPSGKFDCEGKCENICSFEGTSCDDGQHCCPGLTCKTGVCGYENATEACSPTQDCATGLTCTNGACCAPQGIGCDSDAGCCTGFSCTGGVCACLSEGGDCSTGEACCAGTTCDGTHHCRAACPVAVGGCQPYGGKCSGDSDCCAAGSCHGGICADPSALLACSNEGGPCTTASDCCGDPALGSQGACVSAADGGHVCHLGVPGDACDSTHRCFPGLNCIVPPPPPPADAGTPDAGIDDGGDDAGIDDGGDDAGAPDAGPADAGPVDAGEPQGTCTVPSTTHTCTLGSSSCTVGDPCNTDPNGPNQGYDPCNLKVSGGSLAYRSIPAVCNLTNGYNGYCRSPIEGEGCANFCTQTAGDSRKTTCIAAFDGSKLCMPACSTNNDCRAQGVYDNYIYNPQPVTNYCVTYNAKAGCQPELCFIEGQAGFDDPSVLYQPCTDHPNSLCLPRYMGSVSSIVGFCEELRGVDAGTSTVGQICDPRAGLESSSSLCGPDATCLGGRCAKLCDASQLGGNNTPGCSADTTCISPQGLDLIADYQFGGCGDPCDPFADLAHSGCANYCGGPPVRCDWIIGDPKVGQPRGFCGAALKTPIATGQPCNGGVVDPCEPGAGCYVLNGTATCLKLCDPQADAGSPDNCPGTQTCNAFGSLTRSGYCQ